MAQKVVSKAIAARSYLARKLLLAFLLILSTYMALVPILHRLNE